jgi:Methane oxygenase PmoA
VAQPVTFKDTKEGAFGIRVNRALDHPSKTAEPLVGANGQTEKRVDTASTTGRYFSSEGKTGEDVWGTRGPWMALTGTIDSKPVTVAILDHPKNQGHPTYWHARGYGLFAANPLGRQGYDPKQEPTSFTLKPGESVTFRHRILVADAQLTSDQMAKEYEGFSR